jgi:hypothetical protein
MKDLSKDLLKGINRLPFIGLRFPRSGLVPAALRRHV